MTLFGTINEAMFDWPWSGIHFLSGLCLGLMFGFVRATRPGRKFWFFGFGLLVLWELLEFTLRMLDLHNPTVVAALKTSVASFAFGQESAANTIGDLVIGSLGMLVGRVLTRPKFSGIPRSR